MKMPRLARLRSRTLDPVSALGIPVGIGLVLLAQAIEGGSLASLVQTTAALIVFGGTLGAVLMSFSRHDVLDAARALPGAFTDEREPLRDMITKLAGYSMRARHGGGLLELQDDLEHEPDPYLRKALSLAVDGVDPYALRDMMEIDDLTHEEKEERPARVFESAGGYAPTFGILGAVLGLIQVMEHLGDPSQLGHGIAIAFVATVYGVGAANLVLLPIASKLRLKAREAARHRQIVIEGVLSIQAGLNPRLLERKLRGFIEAEPAARSRRVA